MKYAKLLTLGAFILIGFNVFAQQTKKLDVYFYEQPLLFFKNEKTADYAGVEADILKEFFRWCEEKKQLKVNPVYHGYKTFNEFYTAMESAPENALGAGTVTIKEERKKNFDFSAPYLKNVAVFVSHGNVPTFSSANPNATNYTSLGLQGLIEKGSIHTTYMKDFVSKYAPSMPLENISGNLVEIFSSDPKYVTYMDIITYRGLLKSSDKYFKIHRDLTVRGENFGFVLHKNSEWTPLINEFMESGFGFTATRKYQQILESYLGYELISTVDML